MWLRGRLALLLTLTTLTACGGASHSQPAANWSTGFWLWRGDPPLPAPDGLTVDSLYFQAGVIDHYVASIAQIKVPQEWSVSGFTPAYLPPAHEYWMVFRFDRQSVPGLAAAPMLTARIAQLRAIAQQRHWNIAGVQLDIDSPTGSLSQYAGFLREVRKGLPSGFGLSITALLDWFRDGTAISAVLDQVDEFVPQFYDVGADAYGGSGASGIAARFDSAKWEPVFNRFGKRFRIGLSSFGRSRSVDPAGFLSDLSPIDIAVNPAFALETGRTDAGEILLTYRATRRTQIGYNEFVPGNSIQFILPTEGAIREAVAAARSLRGNCAGVVFFRWPSSNEVLTMDPAAVLAAAGAVPLVKNPPPIIHTVDGGCAAVQCMDLYLLSANSLNPAPVRYGIHSSAAIDYFLPEQRIPIRMSGSSDLELSLPPYGGRPRILLGRAVSKNPVQFNVHVEP